MAERRTFSGTGAIWLGPADDTEPMEWIGNASSAVLAIEEDKIEQKNYFALGGGTYNSRTNPATGSLAITGLELTNIMQRAGLLATVYEDSAAAVANEEQRAGPGRRSPFDNMADTSVAITLGEAVSAWADATVYAVGDWVSNGGKYWVATSAGTSSGTGPADDTGVSWTDKGTSPTVPSAGDFTVDEGGAVLDEDYTWPNGAPLLFSYTSKARTRAEAFTTGAPEWRMRFVGFNEAESDTPTIVDVWKVKFSPADLELITEDFGEFNIEGSVLVDSTKGAGESGFYKVQYGSTGGLI